jgi:hypothetical protein
LLVALAVLVTFDHQIATPAAAAGPIHHYLYVFPDQTLYVYDMDNGFQQIQQYSLPMTNGGRGMMVDPVGAFLYLAYNGDGGIHGNGSLLKYDLIQNLIVWTQNYTNGIDSGSVTPDGKTIYMPDGEAAYDGTWHILNTSDGTSRGSIFTVAGNAAHNTIMGFTGQKVYLGGLNNSTFFIASTSTNTITSTIGPLAGGVRPFTINGDESLVFTTHTGLLGFQVSNLTTGQILYTVPVQGFTAPAGSTSAHGISLSPDQKELYLIDTPNSYVHVFGVSGLPGTAPQQLANIPLSPVLGGTESPCLYDCNKEGWMLHVGNGRYVVVGDSGDVIDTTTRTIAYYLPTVNNTRKFLEIDWQDGHPIFTTTRSGMGYVGVPAGVATPTSLTPSTPTTGTPTSTPTATGTLIPGSPTPTLTTTSTATPSSPTPTPSATPTSTPTVTPTTTTTTGPGTVFAQDTFARANQKYWGTASDGLIWGGDANSQAAFSIAGNAGQIANAGGPLNAVLGPVEANAEVFFTGSLSSYSNSNLGAVVRWQNSTNWYKAYISGTTLVIQSDVNGTRTILAQTGFAASANTSYSIRFRVLGTTLYVKAWLASATEPTAWTLTTTNSAFASGQAGLRIQAESATARVMSFVATAY